jgi:ribose-phosphate pyrophosphokinase
VVQFSNENIFVRIKEVVREQDVFVIQPGASPVNNNIMELLIMMDALKRASAARITAVVPYYAYGRTDKKDQPRVPITARLVADIITVAGANRVLTMDLHAGQIQGFFSIPVDELTAVRYLADHFAQDKYRDDFVVVSPDLGAAKRARNFADRLHLPLAVIEKRRMLSGGKTEIVGVIGDVSRKKALIIDDEIDTAGSITQAAQMLERFGAHEVYAAATHAVLSGPAIERLQDSNIKVVVVTDTLPLPEHKRIPKITVLSVARMFAEAISRIHSGGSVGELFR